MQDSNLTKRWESSAYFYCLLCSEHEEQSPPLRTTIGEGIYHPYESSLSLYQRSKEEANCKSLDDEESDVLSKYSS